MCLQCLCQPDVFNKCIGDFVLMRATKDPYESTATDQEWTAGEFGLIKCNDPSFKFKTTPVKVKDSWLDIKNDDDSDEWFNASCAAKSIEEELLQSVMGIKSFLELVQEATGDISKYKECDVPMAIMKVLHEAIESGFKTNDEIDKEINDEEAAAAEAVSVAGAVVAT